MDGCKVAIITRTKNRPLLLHRAIQSVANQTYKNYVHIIVNDGDPLEHQTLTGGTIIVPINSGGRMEKSTNEGVAVALAEGATHITLLDDDDTWSDEYLDIMVRELLHYQKASPVIGGVICKLNVVYEKIEGNVIITEDVVYSERHGRLNQDIGILDINYLADRNFCVNQFLYSVDVLKRMAAPADGCPGPYAESFPILGDWEFNKRFIQVADIAIVPHFLTFYHMRTSAAGADANSIYEIDRKIQWEVLQHQLRNYYIRKEAQIGS